jgi:hypothetical protein
MWQLLFGKKTPDETRSIPQGYYQQTNGTHSYSLIDPEFAVREPYGRSIFGHRGSRWFTDDELILLFHSIPEIFAPIHEIASRVSDAVWELKKWNNDQTVYDDADFNRLFSTPCPGYSFKKLIYESVCYYLVLGKEYLYFNIPDSLSFDYRNIITWMNLPADRITIKYKDGFKLLTATSLNDLIEVYKFRDTDKNEVEIKPDKVLPFHNINLNWDKKHVEGCSPLQSAQKAIDNLVAVYEARGVIYRKRGALGAIVSAKSDQSGQIALTPKEKDSVKADFQNTYGLEKNKDQYVITDQPIDFIRFGMSIEELQPFEETLADASAVYAALGVPREMMPRSEGSTFENYNQAEKSFYQKTVIPLSNQIADGITNYFRLNVGVVDSRMKRYINPSFNHIEVLQENKKEKADTAKVTSDTMLQEFLNGICSLNDWIIARDGKKGTEGFYDKKIFEMTPEELDIVKNGLNLKAPPALQQQPPAGQDNKVVPLKKVVNE